VRSRTNGSGNASMIPTSILPRSRVRRASSASGRRGRRESLSMRRAKRCNSPMPVKPSSSMRACGPPRERRRSLALDQRPLPLGGALVPGRVALAEMANELTELRQGGARRRLAGGNALPGAVEIENADAAQLRKDHEVGWIAGETRARNPVLHDVER